MMKRTVKARVEKPTHKHIQVNIQKQRQLSQIFASSGWLSVNRGMMKTYGALCALFMSQVIDSFEYHASRNQLQSDGSFFMKTAVIAETLGMSEHQVRRCKMEMKEAGAITTIMKGVPPKEFYFLDIGIVLRSVYRINPKEIGGLTLKELEEYIKDLKDKNPNSNKENIPQPTKKINPDQFEEFWKLYPRKVGKPAAKLKWEALSKKPVKHQPSFQTIKEAIQAYIDSGLWEVEQYIPHPSTWLNQERWNDEIPESVSKGSANKSSRSKIGTRNMECHDKEVVFSTGEIYKGEKE